MKLKKIIPLLFAAFLFPFIMNAQVTTSSITGFVKSDTGEPLEGATITAVHVPSGTKYATLSKKDGNFTLPNTRIGGPYTVTAEFVGYQPQTLTDISLNLGEPYVANITLSQKATVLSEITIAAGRKAAIAKTGASTILNARQIADLPSISRSISDFTRLTPQSNGNNFSGRDGRFNNIQVDGANLNNNFGLSTDPMPGGGASPISIETFDQISVNIAPYDVRQSGFTGAGINVNTKSGTNTFHGSAYGYYRDQSFNGTHAGKVNVTSPTQKNKVYGATLGGPIIKNKLFFFANAEWENSAVPNANTFVPTGSNASGTKSFAPKDSLDKFRDVLKSKHNYDAGVYDNRPNYITKNRKLLAKINWNISEKHKLVLKYSDYKGSDQSPLNGSSVPNGGGFIITTPGDTSKPTSRLPNNRNSNQSIGFSNSDYATDHVVQSATLELNSNFNSRFSNQLLLAYTHIDDKRNSPGGMFPTIEIFNADGTVDGVTKGTNYMTAGTDPFTRNNEVLNNISTITDNLTFFKGRHTFTAGATYEYQRLGNAFMQGSEGYYIYNTLNDFVTDAPPAFYAYTYSLVPGQPKVFSANLKMGQLGVYLQDEFHVNDNFLLTYGIRGDVPTYLEQPRENPAITALQFPDVNGKMMSFNTGKWPKASLLLSPRVGFRWKADNNGLIVRGGTGVFTGKIPFVFLTNMPSNSGVYQNGVTVTKYADLAGITFNPDPDAYISKFPSTVTAKAPSTFVLIDPKFKFPQVWRTNIGVDKPLGNGLNATVDVLYTKDLNDVKMRNANLKAPDGNLTGADTRPYFTSNDKFLYPNLGEVIVLENTHKGYSFSATGQISKAFTRGLFGSLAYTYTYATEVSPNPGSRANSAWESIANRGTSNDVELYYSSYAIPHRVVGNISYRLEYAGHLASTISLYYEGASQGNISYVVGGDLNGDRNNKTDLMYIYSKGSDVPFVRFLNKDGSVKYTVEQQQAAYDQFVSNSKYLSKHKGEYAKRNSAFEPWYNRVDMRFLQDFYLQTGNTKHTLQFSLDVINLPNLINRNWGIHDFYTVNNPLTFKKIVAGAPTYTWAEYGTGLVTDPFVKSESASTTWGMQLGLKYIF